MIDIARAKNAFKDFLEEYKDKIVQDDFDFLFELKHTLSNGKCEIMEVLNERTCSSNSK